ncbi:hypothetical protein CBR_g66672 [Chara braunii]|uniref:Uncharacterized protein n=1 Tax=Chara braunii TaxID=69332 RepID=A0A388JPZ8_CHABU|nr:hypothetical protein CBR_g66672 [Chara braunii]|eukprot:GBG59865.1 hypothetical protein CBR_g66672 [Chara braunii]
MKKALVIRRPAEMRFGTAYMMLERLYDQREGLDTLVSSERWARVQWVGDARERMPYVRRLCRDDGFWRDVKRVMDIMGPVYKFLRDLDRDCSSPTGLWDLEAILRQRLRSLDLLDVDRDTMMDIVRDRVEPMVKQRAEQRVRKRVDERVEQRVDQRMRDVVEVTVDVTLDQRGDRGMEESACVVPSDRHSGESIIRDVVTCGRTEQRLDTDHGVGDRLGLDGIGRDRGDRACIRDTGIPPPQDTFPSSHDVITRRTFYGIPPLPLRTSLPPSTSTRAEIHLGRSTTPGVGGGHPATYGRAPSLAHTIPLSSSSGSTSPPLTSARARLPLHVSGASTSRTDKGIQPPRSPLGMPPLPARLSTAIQVVDNVMMSRAGRKRRRDEDDGCEHAREGRVRRGTKRRRARPPGTSRGRGRPPLSG